MRKKKGGGVIYLLSILHKVIWVYDVHIHPIPKNKVI